MQEEEFPVPEVAVRASVGTPAADEAAGAAPAAQAAAGEGTEPGNGRGRGRKLRTPFRRRRGDAAAGSAGSGEAAAGESAAQAAEPADARGAEREAEQALSYLDQAARSEQRLGKYLNSDAAMPKLHKVLADAGIGSRREMEELIT